MKYWIVFSILKVLEIVGIVFAPHYLGKLICKKFPNIRYNNVPPYWLVGFMGILVITAILLVLVLFVVLNIELTNDIMRL